MSEALWSLERKCSETVVGLERFVCLFVFILSQLGQSQTYPEEERPCLSKYWNGKIYFPNREINLSYFTILLPARSLTKLPKITFCLKR